MQALLDSAPYPQLETRLTPLIGDKKPFDLDAKGTLAMARLLAGQTAAAKSDFTGIVFDTGCYPDNAFTGASGPSP